MNAPKPPFASLATAPITRTPTSRTLERSMELLEQARRKIPGLTQSTMKRPEQFAPGSFPVYLECGHGAVVRDVDGNEYVDYICGLGANTLGHQHPVVRQAIASAMETGVLQSLPTAVELEATQALLDIIPGAEMARNFKTGADATSASIRLARHLTKRDEVIVVGYNGWHDHFMFDTPGVPADLARWTTRMPLFQPPDEHALLDLVASRGERFAILLLALPYNHVVSREFLLELRDACRNHGVKFVLDEIVTGFRLALGGAQQHYDVDADWVTLSKGIAAGMPLSAIVGPRESLAKLGDLQVSTTFGGETLSLAVCRDVLAWYRSSDYIPHIHAMGRMLAQGINKRAEAMDAPLRVLGYDTIPFFRMSTDMPTHVHRMTRFVGEMAQRGVLLRRDVNFISHAHTREQVSLTIEAAEDTLRVMKADGLFNE